MRERRGPLINRTHSAHFQGDLMLLRIDLIRVPKRKLRYLKRE